MMTCELRRLGAKALAMACCLAATVAIPYASPNPAAEPIDSALSRSTASTTTETRPYVATVSSPQGVTVLFSGSRGGKLEPCGCRSLNLGGIDREAEMIRAFRAIVPAIVQVDAGGFFREFSDPTMQLEAYHLLEALRHLKVDAMNVGYWDLRQGIDVLKDIGTSLSLPLISANIIDTATRKPVFPAYKEAVVKTSAGQNVKIAIVGVTASNMDASRAGRVASDDDQAPSAAGPLTPAQLTDPAPAGIADHESLLLRNRWTLPGFQTAPAPPPLGGASAPAAKGGGNSPALDFAITTATAAVSAPYEILDEIEALKPLAERLRKEYDVLILACFSGKARTRAIAEALPQFDIVIAGEYLSRVEPQKVGSAGTLMVAPDHDGKYLGQVDIRLEGSKPTSITAELHPILQSIEPLKEVSVYVNAFKRDSELMPIPETQKIAQKIYAGATSCRSCHIEAYNQWKSHKHSHAMKSLVDKGMQFNGDCLRCHTVAYKQPGGFTDLRVTASLANVQCESCHGPGQKHAEEMRHIALAIEKGAAATSGSVKMKMEWDEQYCRQCHDPQNDPFFNYSEDIQRVRHKNPTPQRIRKTTVPLEMM